MREERAVSEHSLGIWFSTLIKQALQTTRPYQSLRLKFQQFNYFTVAKLDDLRH